jgi:hypothetical protein
MKNYPKMDKNNRARTPWAVNCFGDDGPGHGLVYLTSDEYALQLSRPDAQWRCPICGMVAEWDDDNHDDWYARVNESLFVNEAILKRKHE